MSYGPSNSVCVFCGSSRVVDPRYFSLASEVGALLAAKSLRVVYGGASVGMMGALADSALLAGGAVFGVIPQSLDQRELTHKGLTELSVVRSMYERKEQMFRASGAFVALPGGFGTLDELFEALTERQIGLHDKRVVLLEHDGFWAGLREWVERAVRERFVPDNVAHALEVVDGVKGLDAWLDGWTSSSAR
jgi:uncharacterized protein (TIGR00730 family)